MEDIESIVDQVLAGHSSEHVSTTPPRSRARPPQEATVHVAAPPVPPPRPSSSTAVPGSVEDMVERILRGERVQDTAGVNALDTAPHSGPAATYRRESEGEADDDLEDGGHVARRSAQRVRVPGSWHTSPPATTSEPRGRARRASARSAEPSSYSHAGPDDDPLLRRFELWQERKDVKRIQAIYEALVREKAECPFEPDLRPETLLLGPSQMAAKGASSGLPPPPAQMGGESRHDEGSSSAGRPRERSSSRQSSAWQSLMAPSRLYDQNQAWGYEEHVDRLRAAQARRESRERQDEHERTRYADFATFDRGPTKFEPFQLSTSNLGRARAGHAALQLAEKTARTMSTPPASAAAERTALSIHHDSTSLGDGAFDTLAPHIRQALLFTPEMNARLRQATAATLHHRDTPLAHPLDPSATPSVLSEEEGVLMSGRGGRLPPTGHFSSTSASILQLL